MKKTLILNDHEDAAVFTQKPFQIERIITINPSAYALVKDLDADVITASEKYSDISHIRTAIHRKKFPLELKTQLENAGFGEMAVESCANLFSSFISCASFLYYLTKDCSEYCWYDGKKLKSSASHIDCFKYFMDKIWAEYSANKILRKISPFHSFILQRYNDFLRARLAKRRKLFLLDGGGRPTAKKFLKEIEVDIVTIAAREPGRHSVTSIKRMFKSQKKLRKENSCDFFIAPHKNIPSLPGKIEANSSSHPFRKTVFKLYGDLIANFAKTYEGLDRAGKEVTKAFSPELVLTDGIHVSPINSACKEVQENGGQVVLFNHSPHTPQSGRISEYIANLWGSEGRIYSPYATHNVIRSPKIADLVYEIYGDDTKKAVYPLIHSKTTKPEKPSNSKDKFRIIFAGNYLQAIHHVPWMTETAQEFADSILNLAEAASKIPELHLTFKLKARKKECNQDVIEKLMPKYTNVDFKSSHSFAEDLKNCDLVVANLSTTIDEALEAGVPVLLYSSTYHYFHYEGMKTPPTKSARAAVYNPQKGQNLLEFIKSIVAAHKDKSLLAEELEEYLWSNDADNMQEFAKKIFS